MSKITIAKGNITSFKGDAFIIPCDTDLTYKKGNAIIQYFVDISRKNDGYTHVVNATWNRAKEYESNLLKELASIGNCEIGNAVITKAYLFDVKHFIFMPFFNHNEPENKMDFVLLHQALRSALNLATLYEIKTLAIPLPVLHFPKEEVFTKFVKSLFEITSKKTLQNEEMMDIIMGVSEEYKNTSLEEIEIYR